ncbi:hypothetical protein HOY34_08790 [Xinfangfangia sp. D13-10-4-6]|uniref:hypothetical protein n=1 Tax=Pseudogemmobacter hezensis TaxID=2737662 RepID=UPI0015531615|nr:hypothetical protein [Pseudogemmobacter hezensis]NPD15294.1 hypothetical protein [Pseudogemmobacter hezensis]
MLSDHLQFGARMKALPHKAAIRNTFLGQAHIAGTGPEGKTCRECAFWEIGKVKDRIATPPRGTMRRATRPPQGRLKKGGCHKLKHRKANRRFTCNALACCLFGQRDEPPPAIKHTPEAPNDRA